MKTILIPLVRTGLLFAAAATVLGGHNLLASQLFDRPGMAPVPAGFACMAASLGVWLCTGVFVLPLLRWALGAGRVQAAVPVVLGTALIVVTARAAVEAASGHTLVGLPWLSLAAALAIVGAWRTRSSAGLPLVVRRRQYVPTPLVQFTAQPRVPGRLPRAS